MVRTYADLEKARVVLGRPGLAGTGITEAQLDDITSRLGAMEGHGIADHPDTDIDSPVEGQILQYDASGKLVNVTPGGGVRVRDHTAAVVTENAGDLTFRLGLTASQGTGDQSTRTFVAPNFGTDANTIAEGNHLHPVPVETRHVLVDPGAVPVITSGSRNLVTATVGTFAVNVPTKVDVMVYLHGEGVDDPCLFDLEVVIDGNTASTADIPSTQRPTFEWGVNGQWQFRHSRVITRATGQPGSRDVTFRVVWRNWGGLKVHQAWMYITRTAYR